MPPPVLASEPAAEPLQDTPAAAPPPAVEAAATPEPVETPPLAPVLQPAAEEEVLQVTKERSETKEVLPVASVTSSKLPPVRGAVMSAPVQDEGGAAGEPADHDPKSTAAAAADKGSELHASAPEHNTAAEPGAAAEGVEEAAAEKRVEADEAGEHAHAQEVEQVAA